jgi:adenylate cyclase
MLKKILTTPWTAVLTLAVVLAVRIVDPTFVESVRLRYFDTLITSKAPTLNNIYTVNIDEAALDQYGQYPFDRRVYADLVRDLYQRGAGLVVFNIVMSERDRSGGDAALAQALKKYPVVLSNIPAGQNKNTPHPPGSAVIGAEHSNLIVRYPGLIANLPSLEFAAQGSGIVNTLPEIDGVVRRMPLVVSVDGQLYPALSLETLMIGEGNANFQVKMSELGIEKMRGPGTIGVLNTDRLGRIWIDWSQRSHSVSMTRLPNTFNNAVVIVGVTAAGIANPVPTPAGAVWPQDVQAAVMATVAGGVNIQRPAWADGAELIVLTVSSLILLFLSRWMRVGIITTLVVLFSVVPISHFLYSQYAWLVDASYLLAGIVLVVLHAYGVKFVSEFLQKQQIKKQFGSYVNPTIVERLQQHPELIRLGGEKKELSVVMTDMRNFTTLGESYGEAGVEDFTQVMNNYMTALSVPILKNDGTLIKFIGDASLHIHGAPIDDPEHARRAVQTALEMIEAVKGFNEELAVLGKPPVGMGAGVNTGEIVVGNIGAKTKFGYDVLGDAVSLAARLESQTKAYGVLLLLSENTARLIKDNFQLAELDNLAVKGKTEPVRIFTVAKSSFGHQEFLTHYYSGNWKKALQMVEYCKGQCPELSGYYNSMSLRLSEGVPKTWSGVYIATSK